MTACRIARTYRVAHTTIVRLSPALRSPEARPCLGRRDPLSTDPGGRLPGSLVGGSRATTRGAIGPCRRNKTPGAAIKAAAKQSSLSHPWLPIVSLTE
jgi:hypothetical protein